jgi:hypothetical protein
MRNIALFAGEHSPSQRSQPAARRGPQMRSVHSLHQPLSRYSGRMANVRM